MMALPTVCKKCGKVDYDPTGKVPEEDRCDCGVALEPTTWQPIDTAPQDGTLFLAYGLGGMYIAYWCDYFNKWKEAQECLTMDPDYWMPLPEPPQHD